VAIKKGQSRESFNKGNTRRT